MATRGLTDSTQRVSFYDDAINPSHQNNLWRDCPLLEWVHDPSIGYYSEGRFDSYYAAATTGDWVLTQATSGSAAMSTTITGALAIDAGAVTSGQGAQIQRVKAPIVPAAGKDIWFECTVQATNPTKLQTFIGLAEIDTTIIAGAALTTGTHIGWSSVTSDGVLLRVAAKASAAVTATATTLAASTNVKLGFKVTGVTSIDQYINGVLTGTAVATANVPIVALYPSFVCQAHGTSQPVLSVLYYRCFQLR
jgi:hypothetical protein